MTYLLAILRQALSAFAGQQTRVQAATWIGDRAFCPVQPPNAPKPLSAEALGLLYNRLGRLARRFAALFARWQSNTLPTPRAQRARTTPRPATPLQHFPRAQGWLTRRMPQAAPGGGMLEALLHDPEMPRFIAAAPQAGRLLRPLCRALGQPLPNWLQLPPRPKPAPQPRPQPAPHPPRQDRPLPSYVRAAVRAWKKYDR